MIRAFAVLALAVLVCAPAAAADGIPDGSTGAATAAGLLGIVYWMARELVQTMREHLRTVDRSIDRLSAAVERALESGAVLRATSPGDHSPEAGHDRAR